MEWLSDALFIAGGTFGLLAAVGVLRMPDVFTRMQASTKASTLGLGCLLAAVALRHPELSYVVRAASIAAFMLCPPGRRQLSVEAADEGRCGACDRAGGCARGRSDLERHARRRTAPARDG